MKKITTLFFLLIASVLFSQKALNNYSFIKLYITNSESEILLVKWGNSWEIPGKRYNDALSISKTINNIAKDMGIKHYESLALRGLFTFHYTSRPNPTIMHYYALKYTSGKVVPLPGCTDIEWYSYEEAMRIIPYEDMKTIIKALNKDKCSVLGGAVKKTKDPETKNTKIEFSEPIYKLSSCEISNE